MSRKSVAFTTMMSSLVKKPLQVVKKERGQRGCELGAKT